MAKLSGSRYTLTGQVNYPVYTDIDDDEFIRIGEKDFYLDTLRMNEIVRDEALKAEKTMQTMLEIQREALAAEKEERSMQLGTYIEPETVNHPPHYNMHPSGIECIQITEHMNFNIGNAVKYLWRADLKNGLEDLKKAQWYITREIERQENEPKR